MRLYALMHIPERCALVGGQLICRAPEFLGVTTEAAVGTEYSTIWSKTVTVGKTYFIPMLIAPAGGMNLFLGVDIEPVVPGVKAASTSPIIPKPMAAPTIFFSGRLMVPSEEHLDWRTVQVQPVEIPVNPVITIT